MKFSFLIACIASALSLGAAEFDPGGTAFDFAEISNRRFLTSSTGKNLFGEWRKSPPWVHLRDGRLANELRPKITPLVEFSHQTAFCSRLSRKRKSRRLPEAAVPAFPVHGSRQSAFPTAQADNTGSVFSIIPCKRVNTECQVSLS